MSRLMEGALCAIHRLPLNFLYTNNQLGRSVRIYGCGKGCRYKEG